MRKTDMPLAIFWFRQDLRLGDNAALRALCEAQFQILPVFVLDDENAGPWAHGGASRWWLHHSLKSLSESTGGALRFYKGRADEILPALAGETGARAVYWNRCYEPWRIARDRRIKENLKSQGLQVETFKDSLLWEPWEVLKQDGTPYRVFTPFYNKACLPRPVPPPQNAPQAPHWLGPDNAGGTLDDLGLMPRIKWYSGIQSTWAPGEKGAQTRLREFLQHGLSGYKAGRDRPDLNRVSALSPHLHFGEISPRMAWHSVRAHAAQNRLEADAEKFCAELGWREFSYNLLYHFPDLPAQPLQPKFAHFPWQEDETLLRVWQTGRTGIPIVDAGMRQLWQTGWMHNRVRMIVASVLVKNMLLPWQEGEKWFWDCLVDADLASNAASWQWVAGCGADAAPYFRIFNPVTQGQKFDPDGAYVRRFVPELASMPAKFIHAPWEAPALLLQECGLHLGTDYPLPVIDLKETREKALLAFEKIKAAS